MENYMVSEIMDLNYNGLYWIGGIGKNCKENFKDSEILFDAMGWIWQRCEEVSKVKNYQEKTIPC